MTREEVHNLSPSLKEASEMKSPFAVPQGYFNELEAQVETRLQLNKMTSKNEFSTPEDYFDSVEDSVIAKLKAAALHKDSKPQSVPDGYLPRSPGDTRVPSGKMRTEISLSRRSRPWVMVCRIACFGLPRAPS